MNELHRCRRYFASCLATLNCAVTAGCSGCDPMLCMDGDIAVSPAPADVAPQDGAISVSVDTAIAVVIEEGGRTLDAQGDTNVTWKFQVATTLILGCQGAAAPQSIILAGGAPAKNVFW